MIAVLLTILASSIPGLAITRTIDREIRGYALAGASILIGCGTMALALFFASLVHIEWTRTVAVVAALLPLLVFARSSWASASQAAVGGLRSRRPRVQHMDLPSHTSRTAIAIDALLLLLIIGHAIYATWSPMYEWDYFGIWGLKAKVFFESGGVNWRYLSNSLWHPDYPLLTPLLMDLPSVMRRAWDDRFVGLMYTALASGLILIARGHLEEELKSDRLGALGALAIACPALNLWVGLGEGPVAAYGCAGLLFVRRGVVRSSNPSIYLGAVLLGFAAWSKNEGLALTGMAIIAVVVTSWRRAWRLWPAPAIAAIWIITRTLRHYRTDFTEGDVMARVMTHLRSFGFFIRALVIYAPDLRIFWIACFLTLIVFARRAWMRERFLTVALLLQAFLMAAQALATQADIRAHIQYAWNRLPHQIAPAFGFLAVVLLMPAMLAHRPKSE